ncbi:MAG: acetyl-CoA C-acyltransferase, partial [Pirellulales bacterium]|nr:acetyl-CoA C-acyltransferase [Pirellulales bacterium]
MTDRLCIVAAKRTPQGRFLGGLAKHSAVDLARHAAGPLVEQVSPERIDLVVVGNVLSAGQGMNVARQVALELGLPEQVPAFTVNMMCASGMKAVALGAQAVLTGEADVVLAGGSESMSNAPYLLDRARSGYRLGNGVLVDSLLRDGLVDNRLGQHMALTAERLAKEHALAREAQDAFALRSHRRYFEALAAGRYADEIVPVGEVDRDEHPRADTTPERLASLQPVFDAEGTVTAANSSGINDGAAMVVLCREETAARHGWSPLCALSAWASLGCDPARMGLGPVHATARLLEQTGRTLDDFDTIELNEAFAAQALA